MSRTLFESSKTALAFAAMTLFGAVAMVGTSEEGGVLTNLAERVKKPDYSQPPSEPPPGEAQAEAPPPEKKQVPGWYESSPGPVFGSFNGDRNADDTGAETTVAPQAADPGPAGSPPARSTGPMHAPLSPTAVIVTN